MLSFTIACLLMISTPGPAVLTIAGIGSGFGFSAGNRFLWGLFTGNAIVAATVVSGLAAIIFAVPYVRETFLAFSVAYLLFLAFKVAMAGNTVGFGAASNAPSFKAGVVFQGFNPKCYAVNTLIYTGFSIFPENLLLEAAAKTIIWLSIWVPVHYLWLYLGISIRKLNLPDHRQRQINITMALVLVIVVVLAVMSQIGIIEI